MLYHATFVAPSVGEVPTSFGGSIVVKLATRTRRVAPPLALRRPSGTVTRYDVLSASGSSGRIESTVSSSFQANDAGILAPSC